MRCGVGTHLAEGAEHEAEGNHWSRPPLGEGVATAVVVEDMPTRQLHTHTHTETEHEVWDHDGCQESQCYTGSVCMAVLYHSEELCSE